MYHRAGRAEEGACGASHSACHGLRTLDCSSDGRCDVLLLKVLTPRFGCPLASHQVSWGSHVEKDHASPCPRPIRSLGFAFLTGRCGTRARGRAMPVKSAAFSQDGTSVRHRVFKRRELSCEGRDIGGPGGTSQGRLCHLPLAGRGCYYLDARAPQREPIWLVNYP